jgi:hypothetical protein
MNATTPNGFSLRHHYIGVLAANSAVMKCLFWEGNNDPDRPNPPEYVARRLGELADALIALGDQPAAVSTAKKA